MKITVLGVLIVVGGALLLIFAVGVIGNDATKRSDKQNGNPTD